MKLGKQELLELQDYINALNEQVELNDDTYNDITKAIDRALDKIRKEQNTIDYYNNYGHTA